MKKLVKKLESIGQSASLKQHANISDMLEANHLKIDLIEETFKNSAELYCLVEPEDEAEKTISTSGRDVIWNVSAGFIKMITA